MSEGTPIFVPLAAVRVTAATVWIPRTLPFAFDCSLLSRFKAFSALRLYIDLFVHTALLLMFV
jgi:hypothetical protein